jgi:hypothetical protein
MFERSFSLFPPRYLLPAAKLGLVWAWLGISPLTFGVQSVTLGWSPSSSGTVAGYRVYYGTASGAYSMRIDVGTNLTCTVTNLQDSTTYYFAGTAYDNASVESAFTSEISYGVATGSLPVILSQPASQTNVAGASVMFTVGASGTGLSYQWFKSGTLLSGASGSSLALTSISSASAGNYSAIVANSAGSVNSAGAILTVITPPVITVQPVSVTSWIGATATFSVTANGTGPLRYQWFKSGSALAGATSATFSLASISSSDAGGYSVAVSNDAGTVMSSTATLTLTMAPVITTQPASLTNLVGSTATFMVEVSGTAPFSYQWLKSGKAISGATASRFSLTNVASANAGNYTVKIANVVGAVTSSVAILTVIAPPAITKQPVSLTSSVGTKATFTVSAAGTAPLRYQWFKSGTPVNGATNSSLTFSSVALTNAGNYTVTVTNVAGAVTSSLATLTVTSGSTKSGGKPHAAISLTLAPTANHWYELQATTNLVDWSTIWQTDTITNESPVEYDDQEAGYACRFYRWIEH